ncbi:MAG: hypothetical protein DME92_02170 [Verrucomicrobia bacterium]|nr:MAG: hypothetical protein DME92_02170 [Verrucomicrobiota bacterium]
MKHARTKTAASPTAAPSPAKPKLGDLFKPRSSAATSPAATSPAPEGSRFYGTTKKGKYMTEADAVKEGDRAAGGRQ